NSNFLQKYTERAGDRGAEASSAEAEETEDLRFFGWQPGPSRERAVSLELRQKTGKRRTIPYGWIELFEFDPSDGITLHVGGRQIHIRGRNLIAEVRPGRRLYDGIGRNKVVWIREADRAEELQAKDDAMVVEAIEW